MVTDEEIVKLIWAGDKEKFGLLVERYQGKLYGYLKKISNQSSEEVEDLVSEVFISSYKNLRGFEAKKKFSSWIFRIAHNKVIDSFRRAKKIRMVKSEDDNWIEEIAASEKMIEEMEIEKEKNKKVMKAIEELELKYREVVLLYFFEDKSYEEISDILHIPTNNVGVILFRAKERLKKLIYER